MMSMHRPVRGRSAGPLLVAGVFAALAVTTAPAQEDPTPRSSQAKKTVALTRDGDTSSFDFETEQIQGRIKLDGAYHGVTRLVDKRTGRQVIDSRYSALNLFFLFSVNQVMGEPRKMERTIQAAADWVEAKWSPTDTHKAEITARYEVRQPNAVDLTVTVRSTGTYPGYEVFMPSYFDKALRPHVYLKPRGTAKEPELVMPALNDVFRGTLLAFPRDAHAARRCVDGRWDWDGVIQVCPVRRYAHCLAFVADPDQQVAAVLMARPRDCGAITARYHADSDADRLTTYSAFDLSLFGDDLLPGDERSVKVRLALTPLNRELSQPRKLYEAFIAETTDSTDRPQLPLRKE